MFDPSLYDSVLTIPRTLEKSSIVNETMNTIDENAVKLFEKMTKDIDILSINVCTELQSYFFAEIMDQEYVLFVNEHVQKWLLYSQDNKKWARLYVNSSRNTDNCCDEQERKTVETTETAVALLNELFKRALLREYLSYIHKLVDNNHYQRTYDPQDPLIPELMLTKLDNLIVKLQQGLDVEKRYVKATIKTSMNMVEGELNWNADVKKDLVKSFAEEKEAFDEYQKWNLGVWL